MGEWASPPWADKLPPFGPLKPGVVKPASPSQIAIWRIGATTAIFLCFGFLAISFSYANCPRG